VSERQQARRGAEDRFESDVLRPFQHAAGLRDCGGSVEPCVYGALAGGLRGVGLSELGMFASVSLGILVAIVFGVLALVSSSVYDSVSLFPSELRGLSSFAVVSHRPPRSLPLQAHFAYGAALWFLDRVRS